MGNAFTRSAFRFHRKLRKLVSPKSEDILEQALTSLVAEVAHDLQIRKFCYYHLQSHGSISKLVSFIGSGFVTEVQEEVELGRLVRYAATGSDPISSSFRSLELGRPIKLCPNGRVVEPKGRFNKRVPSLDIPINEVDLPNQSEQDYYDLPIMFGERVIGKVVCSSPIIAGSPEKTIYTFWNLLLIAAPYFEHIAKSRFRLSATLIAELRTKLDEAGSLDELYKICVNEIPRKLCGCSNASIFTTVEDSNGVRRLVMRASSWEEAHKKRNHEPYPLDTNSLTGYCGYSKYPVRVHGLERESPTLSAQLARINPFLKWQDKITDSSHHDGFLAVPIIDHQGNCLGVIRFTEKGVKHGSAGYFNESDEENLLYVATSLIAPHILRLREAQFAKGLLSYIERIHLLTISGSLIMTQNFEIELCQTIIDLMGGQSNTNHLVTLGVFLNKDEFKIKARCGNLSSQLVQGSRYPIAKTLTAFALQMAEGVHFVDLEVAERLGRYSGLTAGARTALAAPITFCGKSYGTIVLLSDSYDLDEVQKSLLAAIAKLAAEHYARNEFRLDSLAAMGLRHDVAKLINELDSQLSLLSTCGVQAPSYSVQGMRSKIDIITSLLDVYLHPTRYAGAADANKLTSVDILDDIIKPAIVGAQWYCEDDNPIPIEVESSTGTTVRVHRGPLVAMLYNLIKNAIEHGDSKSVRIIATSQSNSLRIAIENKSKSRIKSEYVELLRANELSGWLVGHWNMRDAEKPIGLLLSKGLASLYQLEDGRIADLQYQQEQDIHLFITKIPLPI